jgi:hypothetical protein
LNDIEKHWIPKSSQNCYLSPERTQLEILSQNAMKLEDHLEVKSGFFNEIIEDGLKLVSDTVNLIYEDNPTEIASDIKDVLMDLEEVVSDFNNKN